MKRFLVPTDFSEQAENALHLAAQLARKFEGEIYLLHMLELPLDLVDPVMGSSSNDLPEALFFMRLAHKRFAEIRTRPYLEGITIHEKVLFNAAFDGIMETSRDCNCDLIIMGSKGANGFKELFVGSNTEKVVRTSETPVLVIKKEHPNFKVHNFVFATDFAPEARKILPQVTKFAELFEARLHLVYINTASKFLSSEEADLQMETFMEGTGFDSYTLNVFNDRTVESGILNFAKKLDSNLVGIGTHGRSGIAHFFNGSVSEDLVNHANRPVITFKL